MANFFAELKRRHIYRVAAAYAVVAWLLLQIVNNLAPAFDLPSWITRAVVLLLIIGFPMAVFLAWTRELAPADGAGRATTGRLDWLLVGALVSVVAVVSYQQLTTRVSTEEASVSAARSAAASPNGAISLAVLPFVNLSSDKEQEFFSDGMTEEITSALAKVPNLRVVGRTSAFQFKGENKDLRAIGQALSATHLIEGSVRKDGNQLRITAQLVKADDGTHVWTESYDRELKGVFLVQEEIAQAIAGALRVPLGLQQGDALVRNRIDDTGSYDQYLRARALLRAPTLTSVTEAAKLLEDVVGREPDFAPAWAQLSIAYYFAAVFHPAVFSMVLEQARPIVEMSVSKAQAAAERAVQRDVKSSDAYMSLALTQAVNGKYLAARDLFAKALSLDGNNADALSFYSTMLAELGYVKQALPLRQRLQTLEPFAPLSTRISATIMAIGGQTDEPIAMLKRIPDGFAAIRLAQIYGAQGRYAEAADLLLARSDTYLPGVMDAAAGLLRTAPAVAPSPEKLPRLGAYLQFVYLAVGATGRVLDFSEDSLKLNFQVPTNTAILWARPYEPVRKTDRFKTFVRNAGMVEYWRAKGWPDLCHPTTGDDFECS